jgi:hypothetical protein
MTTATVTSTEPTQQALVRAAKSLINFDKTWHDGFCRDCEGLICLPATEIDPDEAFCPANDNPLDPSCTRHEFLFEDDGVFARAQEIMEEEVDEDDTQRQEFLFQEVALIGAYIKELEKELRHPYICETTLPTKTGRHTRITIDTDAVGVFITLLRLQVARYRREMESRQGTLTGKREGEMAWIA